MQKNNLNILSTRPLDPGLIQKASEQQIYIDCISFIETAPIKDQTIEHKIHTLQSKNITAVFTSMNAVEAVQEYLTAHPHWAIYCIGQTTKELVADTFGEGSIQGIANSASLLADAIINTQQKEVYFFCGDQRRNELPDKLSEAGITLHEVVVYTTSQQSKALLKEYNGILFFSPSAVHSFFASNNLTSTTTVFAIGSTTAAAIQQYTNNQLIIAERPGKEALVHTMMEYFSAIQKQEN
jgi:uroporphyrinogen-III synthase